MQYAWRKIPNVHINDQSNQGIVINLHEESFHTSGSELSTLKANGTLDEVAITRLTKHFYRS